MQTWQMALVFFIAGALWGFSVRYSLYRLNLIKIRLRCESVTSAAIRRANHCLRLAKNAINLAERGDYRNGVSVEGSGDQGEVLASRVLEALKAGLNTYEESKGTEKEV